MQWHCPARLLWVPSMLLQLVAQLLILLLLLLLLLLQVVFDEFGVQLTGWLVKLPQQLPEVREAVSAALP
jgi:hypothetical protein